jgi:hypothetical protein
VYSTVSRPRAVMEEIRDSVAGVAAPTTMTWVIGVVRSV